MKKMPVHPKNHITEYVYQFRYSKKMKTSNNEEGVVCKQCLKADKNEEEAKYCFLKCCPVGWFIWLRFWGQQSVHLKEL
jgi:hypothetical protein